MQALTQIEDFQPHVGKIFRIKGTRHAFKLAEIVCNDRPLPGGIARKPFLLILRGPRERDVLPEGEYACEIEGGAVTMLYVMPIHTPHPDRQDYQVSFS